MPSAHAAPGDPLAPTFPTVYISQVPSGGTTADIKESLQSRAANAGKGGVDFNTIGNAGVSLNAIGYRDADDYVYAIRRNSSDQLLRVGEAGATTELGAITGLPTANDYVAAGFGGVGEDTFYVTGIGLSQIYGIDVDGRTVVDTITLSAPVYTADFTWSNGYFWAISANASSPAIAPTLVRIALDGTVTPISTVGIMDQTERGAYGAAWVYGNGNLAFSYNSTGQITQIKVAGAATGSPTASLVSRIAGPSTSSNDGTTTPADLADLGLTITPAPPTGPGGSTSWSVKVANSGPGGSSGGTFQFAVPSGVTTIDVPLGCQVITSTVHCVSGQIASGADDDFAFSATVDSSFTVPSDSSITMVGNEKDVDATDDTATVAVVPTSQDRTSTGAGTAPQSTTVAKPSSASVYLVNGSGDQVSTLTVPGEGAYTVNTSTGVITFQPVAGYVGTAQAADFVIVPTSGDSAAGTYTPTVTMPAAPTVTDRTSTGVGTAVQDVTVTVPDGGSITLFDALGAPTDSVATDDGDYALDDSTGKISFTPAHGFSGQAVPVDFRVTDGYEQESNVATYTPTVDAPDAPIVTNKTSTGVGTEVQRTSVTVPPGGSVTLLDSAGDPVGSVSTPDGDYSLDLPESEISFTPRLGFKGAAEPVDFQVTDAYGQESNVGTYTPTVTAPAGPTPDALTTNGPLGLAQTTAQIPGDKLDLVGAGGAAVPSVAVAGGTYTVVGDRLRFTPDACFTGSAPAATYQVTDVYDSTGTSTYRATVAVPSLSAGPLTSSAMAPATQSVSVTLPACTTLHLLDAAGNPTATLTRTGEGTYSVTGDTITFVPAQGYSGTPAPVGYRLDGPDVEASSTYTPTVTAPPAPTPGPFTSTGSGTSPQSSTLVVPAGGTVVLLDAAGNPTTSVVVAEVGAYVLDQPTATVTFVPSPGFHGNPPAVTYEVSDIYGQTATSTYTPTVLKPAPPTAADLRSKGVQGVAQERRVAFPSGGSVYLLDPAGRPRTTVTVPSVGTYTVNGTTGVITFQPLASYYGKPGAVGYRVSDAYGQAADARYQPRVLRKAPAVAVGKARLAAPELVRNADTVPATCSLTTGAVKRCVVTAYAQVEGQRVVVGKGHAKAERPGGRLQVSVQLNSLGRALARRPHGVPVALTAEVTQAKVRGQRHASHRSRVVAPDVPLRPVYFDTDSAQLRPADLAYLRSVRARMADVRGVTCIGFTDSRSTSDHNWGLGERRAASVCAVLTRGLDVRTELVTRGETRPVGANTTPDGRQLNRRGEAVLHY